jgi:predicted small metal-binding protein
MNKNRYLLSRTTLTFIIPTVMLVSVCMILVFITKNSNQIDDMKSYELSYDVDFFDPSMLKKFQLEKRDSILKGDKAFIKKEIQFLFSSLKTDQESLLRNSSYCVKLLFDGKQKEFIQKESSDYKYMYKALDSILSKIEKTRGSYFKLDFYFIGVLFRKYALVKSMSETWYLSKRINFSNEFLAFMAPKFANLLLAEDYMSTGMPLRKGDIVNKESMASNIEELMDNDEFHHDFYFGFTQVSEDILREIQKNIDKKENLRYREEATNIDALLKEASQGVNILGIYNK